MSEEFIHFLQDQFAPLGGFSPRRMFGGWGLFRDGRMFALVADDELFLKGDAETRGAFLQGGAAPFVYAKKDRQIEMSYFSVPAEILEDVEMLREWVDLAIAAAARASVSRKKPKTPRK